MTIFVLSTLLVHSACALKLESDDSSRNIPEEGLHGPISMHSALHMDHSSDVAASKNKDVVFVAGFDGDDVKVVDVSNENQPIVATVIDGLRNVKDVQVKGDFLYVGMRGFAGEASGLKIYDVSNPFDPLSVSDNTTSPSSRELENCHNIWPQPDRELVYCASEVTSRLVIVSVGDGGIGSVHNPMVIGSIDPPAGGNSHDMYARGNLLYVAFWNELHLYNIDNPGNPQLLGKVENSTHSVWPTDDGRFVFTTSERRAGDITVWNIENPQSINRVGDFSSRNDASVHNIEVVGNSAFVSYYAEGLKVLDISNPSTPREIAGDDFYLGTDFDEDPPPGIPGYLRGAWGVDPKLPFIYVSGYNSGLRIYSLNQNP